jgi:hypothetical protein
MLGNDPAHELAPVNAGQLFLTDKLQIDRARDRAGVTRLTARVRTGPAVANDNGGGGHVNFLRQPPKEEKAGNPVQISPGSSRLLTAFCLKML